MVNKRELEIVNKYQMQGWKVCFMGAPDLLLFKTDEKGNIIEAKFREIKSPNDKLRVEQHIWRKVLHNFLKCDYKVEVIE